MSILRSPPTHIDTSRPDIPPAHPGVAATASRFFVSVRKSFSPPASPRRKSVTDYPVRHPTPHVHPPPLTFTPHPTQPAAMYSTPEERHARNASRAGRSGYRPTIEQIAMGLHVSRTPHLRPVPLVTTHQRMAVSSSAPRRPPSTPTHSLPVSPDNHHETSTSSSHHRMRHSLPPPPSRSSMKKTPSSGSTLTQPQQRSSSEISPSTSTAISASSGSSHPLSSLRVRMSKFLPGYRPLSLSSSLGRASSFTSSASDSTRPTTPRKAVRFSTNVAIDERSS